MLAFQIGPLVKPFDYEALRLSVNQLYKNEANSANL